MSECPAPSFRVTEWVKARLRPSTRGLLLVYRVEYLLLRPLAILGAALPWVCAILTRPWHPMWGPTEEELEKPLPGDELVPDPAIESKLAIPANSPVYEV